MMGREIRVDMAAQRRKRGRPLLRYVPDPRGLLYVGRVGLPTIGLLGRFAMLRLLPSRLNHYPAGQ